MLPKSCSLLERDRGDDVAQMRVQVNQSLGAVKTVVPQQVWGDIVEKLDQPQQHHALAVETEDFEDDDELSHQAANCSNCSMSFALACKCASG